MRFDRWDRLALAGLVLVMLVQVVIFDDYGVSWDEHNTLARGGGTLRFWLRGGQDDSALQGGIRFYPALVGTLAHGLSRLVSVDPVTAQHGVVLVFSWIGLGMTWVLARHLGGSKAGLAALVILAATPLWWGHASVNPKDIPFATAMIAGVYGLVRSLELPGWLHRWGWWTAGWCGVAMGVRSGGLILAVLAGLTALVRWGLEPGVRKIVTLRTWLAQGTVLGLTSWLIMLVFWPWAMMDPIRRPVATLLFFGEHGGQLPVFYQGAVHAAGDLPASYLLERLASMLPETYHLGLLAAGCCLIGMMRFRRSLHPGFAVVAGAVLLPLMAGLIGVSGRYDAARHFLFLLPLLAVVAGWGWAASLVWLHSTSRQRLAYTFLAAGVVILALTVVSMIRLHPFQMIHHNFLLAGGTAAAARHHEMDYWGLSYQEGLRWLVENSAAPRRAATTSDPSFMEAYARLNPQWELVPAWPPSAADYVLHLPRPHAMELPPGRIEHAVKRAGVPLCYVLRVDPSGPRHDWRMQVIPACPPAQSPPPPDPE